MGQVKISPLLASVLTESLQIQPPSAGSWFKIFKIQCNQSEKISCVRLTVEKAGNAKKSVRTSPE